MTAARPLKDLLNPPQYEAATIQAGPICIVAGAGSGKTRVITHRLAYLVQEGLCAPEQCLAVTFTNKAARELKERVDHLLPGVGGRMWVSTFHSAAARILREAHAHVGLSRWFSIYDQDDSERLIKQVCNELNIPKDFIRSIAGRIEQLQNDAIPPEKYEPDPFDVPGKRVREVYRVYMERLRAAGAVDFGGLLVLALQVAREKPEASYSLARVTHAVVDEYQDVNTAQSSFVEALAPRLKSLAVVGDDDQSIYGWRGASSHSLLRFTETFRGARQVRLTENYRSTGRILKVANEIIRRNPGRLGKELWTQAPEGPPIRIVQKQDDREEALMVARDIENQVAEGRRASQLAVLYRTNAQSRQIEETLNRARLPYRLVGGVRFYDRREVKDVLSYARLVLNPDSEMDLRRIINVPARAIGDKTVDALGDLAQKHNIPLTRALDLSDDVMAEAGVKPAARAKLREFGEVLRELRKASENQPPSVVLTEIVARTAYDAYLRKEEDAEERAQNLEQLHRAAEDHEVDMRAAGEQPSLALFLEHAALQSEAEGERKDAEAVTLMTLHAAKGLEFDAVWLIGAEEHVLPSSRAINSGEPEDLSEERRLAYVGVTRARERLTVTMVRRRNVHGQWLEASPSRFFTELPEPFIRENFSGDLHAILPRARFGSTSSSSMGLHRNFPTGVPSYSSAPAPASRPRPQPVARVDRGDSQVEYDDASAGPPRKPSSLFPGLARKPSTDDDVFDMDLDGDDVLDEDTPRGAFRPGARVRHPTYGVGKVLSVTGAGDGARVDVTFGEEPPRRIVARFLRPA